MGWVASSVFHRILVLEDHHPSHLHPRDVTKEVWGTLNVLFSLLKNSHYMHHYKRPWI